MSCSVRYLYKILNHLPLQKAIEQSEIVGRPAFIFAHSFPSIITKICFVQKERIFLLKQKFMIIRILFISPVIKYIYQKNFLRL